MAPLEFIPIAEETGSIIALGAWALRESCERLGAVACRSGRELELSVNVSAHQLAMPGFARSVAKTLSHAEFPAQRLTLDIAETALLHPDGAAATALDELRALGVGIALDDFGTGHASLAWLKAHPVRGIKIAPAFIRDLPTDHVDATIVAGIIAMAGALGATVTAEGVETEAQRDALVALHCQRAQGFLLAMPMLPEHLAAALGC